MGCDIHAYVEKWDGEKWVWLDGELFDQPHKGIDKPWEPFPWRSYCLFGFLAGVRRHDVPPIAECRGIPANVSDHVRKQIGCSPDCVWALSDMCCTPYAQCNDVHSRSWLLASELIGFDFSASFPSEGGVTYTFNEFLGPRIIERFHQIAALADDPAHVRVVFAFDS